jgi:organic hydroperoxide reductase OsmC/OhrA
VAVRPRYRSYAIAVDADGTLTADDEAPLALDERWTPEHVLLAGLAACVITSLRYHAHRATVEADATATASGVVGPREDGSWGFLEIECSLSVSFDPEPAVGVLPDLLARAERGCFVGASLRPAPVYVWAVEGKTAA